MFVEFFLVHFGRNGLLRQTFPANEWKKAIDFYLRKVWRGGTWNAVSISFGRVELHQYFFGGAYTLRGEMPPLEASCHIKQDAEQRAILSASADEPAEVRDGLARFMCDGGAKRLVITFPEPEMEMSLLISKRPNQKALEVEVREDKFSRILDEVFLGGTDPSFEALEEAFGERREE